MEDENNLLRNRTFKTKLIRLPRHVQFCVSEHQRHFQETSFESLFLEINETKTIHGFPSFSLDYARLKDLEICEKFMRDASLAGDNIGEDEFEKGEFVKILNLSEVFVLKSRPTGNSGSETKAFIALQPCMSSRSVDTCQTMMGIYYDQQWINQSPSWSNIKHFSKEAVYTILILFGIQLAKEIEIGYTEALVKVCPRTNPERIVMLQRIGFHVAACIPRAVNMKGSLEEDFTLVKNFAPPRPPRPKREILEMMDGWAAGDETDRIFHETPFMEIPFLPLKYRTHKGTILTIRTALKSDVTKMFDLFVKAGSSGNGYGINEYPTLRFFKSYILKSFNIIHETYDIKSSSASSSSATPTIVGCSLILPSCHVRSKGSRTAESSIVLDESFRGRGIGKEIILLEKYFTKKLGFRTTVSDVLESNAQMRGALSELSDGIIDLTIGLLPKGAFTPRNGWEGQILHFTDLENRALSEILSKVKNRMHGPISKL